MTVETIGLYALSIKQPWATLLLHGLKTIEVRNWSTPRRGAILLHAGRVPDARPEGWKHLPKHLEAAAQLTGGILGRADIIACHKYTSLDQFQKHQSAHLNELAWFQPPVLFGFELARPEMVPFRAYPGWFKFFPVDPETADTP